MEMEEIKKISGHVNHNVVSTIASLATKLRTWANDIERNSGEEMFNEYTSLPQQIMAYNDSVLEAGEMLQRLRARVVSDEDVTETDLTLSLEHAIDVVSDTSAFLRKYKSDKNVLLTASKHTYERCRKQANHCERVLKNVYINQTDIHLRPMLLSLSNIVRIAFENVPEKMRNDLNFDNVVDMNSDYTPVGNMFGDYDKLAEVFMNLFENSFKYSGVDSSLRIKVNIDRLNRQIYSGVSGFSIAKSQRYIEVRYSDNGRGVDVGEEKKVFDKGYRNSKWKDDLPGLGYGLYYCSKVMRKHGGCIFYEKPHFVVLVPVYKSAEEMKRKTTLLE